MESSMLADRADGTRDGSVVRSEVEEVFSQTFHHEGTLDFDTPREAVAGWDSLQHVALIAALESRFAISLSMDEMIEATSIAGIHAILDRHGV